MRVLLATFFTAELGTRDTFIFFMSQFIPSIFVQFFTDGAGKSIVFVSMDRFPSPFFRQHRLYFALRFSSSFSVLSL